MYNSTPHVSSNSHITVTADPPSPPPHIPCHAAHAITSEWILQHKHTWLVVYSLPRSVAHCLAASPPGPALPHMLGLVMSSSSRT
jgi:hypothetical protein